MNTNDVIMRLRSAVPQNKSLIGILKEAGVHKNALRTTNNDMMLSSFIRIVDALGITPNYALGYEDKEASDKEIIKNALYKQYIERLRNGNERIG